MPSFAGSIHGQSMLLTLDIVRRPGPGGEVVAVGIPVVVGVRLDRPAGAALLFLGPLQKLTPPRCVPDIQRRRGLCVYKSYDPRAKVVRKILDDVFSLTGPDPLIDVAMQLEKIALSDDYFKSKKLYPNVDFYSGLIYKAMGIPTDVFTVLFTIPRLAGWLAHWSEWVVDPENRIYRPFQVYKGEVLKDYEPMASRKPSDTEPKIARSAINRRRDVTLGKVKPEYSRILHGQDN
eukprot:g474.t1